MDTLPPQTQTLEQFIATEKKMRTSDIVTYNDQLQQHAAEVQKRQAAMNEVRAKIVHLQGAIDVLDLLKSKLSPPFT